MPALSHNDDHVANRRFGRSRRGTRAKGVVIFRKGIRYSALGIMAIDGMPDCHITKGGYDALKFARVFKKKVLQYLRPYPQRHSVLVMDNCPNLHTQRGIVDMVHDVGARVERRPPRRRQPHRRERRRTPRRREIGAAGALRTIKLPPKFLVHTASFTVNQVT